MMNQEQFNLMMQTMQELARAMTIQAQTTVQHTPTSREHGEGHGKRTIETKAFNRLTKFGKGEENWKEYNSPETQHTLQVIEDHPKEVSTEGRRCLVRWRFARGV